jgi:hypothetical protein
MYRSFRAPIGAKRFVSSLQKATGIEPPKSALLQSFLF